MAGDERAAVPVGELDLIPGLQGYLGYPVSLSGVRNCLAKLSLHVVTDAQMRVLEEAEAWAVEFISYPDGTGVTQYGDVMGIAKAELARREATPRG